MEMEKKEKEHEYRMLEKCTVINKLTADLDQTRKYLGPLASVDPNVNIQKESELKSKSDEQLSANEKINILDNKLKDDHASITKMVTSWKVLIQTVESDKQQIRESYLARLERMESLIANNTSITSNNRELREHMTAMQESHQAIKVIIS